MADVVQIVVAPGSGDGRAPSTARRLQKALVRRGYETHIQTFSEFERLVQWAATCEPTFSHLIGVGGDATLEAAAGAAVRLSTPFVPVPNGFGNIFARAFGHADQTRRVMELFEHGQVRRVDVGTVNDAQMFLTHHSYGMLEEIQQAVERGRARPRSRLMRHLAYYAMARRFLFTDPLPAIRVEVDGTLLAEDAAVVTVANVETYRGFLSLTPTASPIDGLFDVFVIPRTTRLGVWMRLLKLLLGLAGRWKGIVLGRGRRVRVTGEDGVSEELAVRCGALPLLIPPGSVKALKTRQAEADVPADPDVGPAPAAPKVMARRVAAQRPRA
jgi:diacylglycerol kinase (ATP)